MGRQGTKGAVSEQDLLWDNHFPGLCLDNTYLKSRIKEKILNLIASAGEKYINSSVCFVAAFIFSVSYYYELFFPGRIIPY